MSVQIKRDTGRQAGWTLTVDGDRLTLSGGSFADACGPVEIDVGELDQFLADLQALMARRPVA